MIRRLSIALLVLLSSCSPEDQAGAGDADGSNRQVASGAGLRGPPPEAYLHAVDRVRARAGRLGEVPCTRSRIEDGYPVTSSLPTDRCVRMLPRQRFRGVWLNRFEVSVFWPDRVVLPEREPPFWLSMQNSSLAEAEGERAYLIEFEGRRTMYPGSYGYGDYQHEIIVDRVISAKPLPDQR